MTAEKTAIECHFCGTKVESLEAAIQADWFPSFYIGDDETCNPFCPGCREKNLRLAEDGEWELVMVQMINRGTGDQEGIIEVGQAVERIARFTGRDVDSEFAGEVRKQLLAGKEVSTDFLDYRPL